MERKAQCILGNGECPEDCELFKYSQAITNALGDNFDPKASRRSILLADATNHDVTVADIARVRQACNIESKKMVDESARLQE